MKNKRMVIVYNIMCYNIKLLVVVTGILQNLGHQVSADFHSPLIEYLPGFSGPLPFQLTTGYVGVDKSDDVQLFYYFVKSQTNPRDDPLILWMTGGPGCSSFTALAYELGPLYFEQVEYNGTLPTLTLNFHTWTKAASIIFLDLPVGTGFSYGKTSIASHSSDPQACAQALQFLKKWFISHPQFLTNPFYVAGDSYAGIFVPVITQMISDENEGETGPEQSINLKGYLLGNPATFPTEINFRLTFAHGMGIISDELYESLRRNCGHDYQTFIDDAECSKAMETYELCWSGLFRPQILEKYCVEPLRRSLSYEKAAVLDKSGDQNNPKLTLSLIKCRNEGYALSSYWINDENVQKALHIRQGTIGTWIRCKDELLYDKVITDTRPYHANLSRKGYKSLIYSGDHDFVVPFQSTQAWIRGLNYSIIDDWRPWIVEGQYAGYTRTYSNKMTYATVKGGGHTAPEYKPAECYAMFKRWLSNKPL